VIVYLDPPSGRILDVVDFRTSLFGVLHRFHENLTIPEYDGRSIVGLTGGALLISVLTGVYLWWPRGGGLRRGVRWRRGPGLLSNLHHMIGIWISLPLAVAALSGIYLAFPQQSRALLASIFPTTSVPRSFNAPLLQPTARNIDQVVDAARTALADARPSTIFLPTRQQGVWRVELTMQATHEPAALNIEDGSGAVTRDVAKSGDRIAALIRGIHQGSRGGFLWHVLLTLCGLLPPLFGLSGIVIALRRYGLTGAEAKRAAPGSPEAAE
jgi:uncharacterized iron-regulated membrane protein